MESHERRLADDRRRSRAEAVSSAVDAIADRVGSDWSSLGK
jgi:hypothetical protein